MSEYKYLDENGLTYYHSKVKNLLAGKVDKVEGKGLSTNDYTTAEKNKLASVENGAEPNQNAFNRIVVGNTTIEADTKADALTITAGNNITLTPNSDNDSLTIAASVPEYNDATTTTHGLMSVIDKQKLDALRKLVNEGAEEPYIEEWSSSETYDENSLVLHNGYIYGAAGDVPTTGTFIDNEWMRLDILGLCANNTYDIGDLYGLLDNVEGDINNINKLVQGGAQYPYIQEWNSNEQYVQYNWVLHNGKMFWCEGQSATKGTFIPGEWREFDIVNTAAQAYSQEVELANNVASNFTYINTALQQKAPLASPTLTGTPKAPTASAGTNTTQIATTAFVKTAIDNVISSITGLEFVIVQTLPQTGEAGKIYLVPNSGTAPDIYDEYAWIISTSSFEKIGSTDVDLSGYVQSSEMVTITNAEIDTIVA